MNKLSGKVIRKLTILVMSLMIPMLIFCQGYSTKGFPKQIVGKDTNYLLTYQQLETALFYCYKYQEDTALIKNLNKQVAEKIVMVNNKDKQLDDEIKTTKIYQNQATTCIGDYNILNKKYNKEVRLNKGNSFIEKISLIANAVLIVLLIIK